MRSKTKSASVGAKKFLHLIFPQKLIKKPLIYTMAKKYNVIPNIRRANITEKIGEVILQLSGKDDDLNKAEKYLKKLGVKVKLIEGDIVE
ncbi:MAG: NIL domain-containing protein [Elusimicrobiota bacterium]|nr:NIL domain-containing protein [Elusimicrobiota bacterium]